MSYEPPRRARGAVQILAILGLILGALAVVRLVFYLLLLAGLPWLKANVPGLAGSPDVAVAEHPLKIAEGVMHGLLGAALCWASFQAYRLSEGARRLMLGVAVALVVAAALALINTFVVDIPIALEHVRAQHSGSPRVQSAALTGGYVVGTMMAIALFVGSLILPGCILYFFTRPDARAQFEGTDAWDAGADLPELPSAG